MWAVQAVQQPVFRLRVAVIRFIKDFAAERARQSPRKRNLGSSSFSMASLHRSVPLTRAFRALSFHPPIPHSSPTPRRPSISPHLQTLAASTSRSFSGRRPREPDTLPFHQHLYSIGYPRGSFDDLTPPPTHNESSEMSLPAPLTLIAIDGEAKAYSMTDKSVVYICKRSAHLLSPSFLLEVGLIPLELNTRAVTTIGPTRVAALLGKLKSENLPMRGVVNI